MEINKTVHNLRFLANQTSSEFNEVRVDLTMLDAANIILNQKKEIERLKAENLELVKKNVFSPEERAVVITNVIEEFAKRLLETIKEHHYLLSDHCNSRDYGMFTIGIEQAVNETKKEMVGAEIAITTETEGVS